MFKKLSVLAILLCGGCSNAFAATPLWKITAYCACVQCCGKSDAITASGKKARPHHTVALNWLPFGTRIEINGIPYVVEDRGAESLFGTYFHRKGPKKQIKHVDIYMASHEEAKRFGVRWLPVEVSRA